MSRSESELRSVYADPPGIDDVEQRLLDKITDISSGRDVHRVRRPSRGFVAPLAGAAAVAAVAVSVVVLAPRVDTHSPHPPTAGKGTPTTTTRTSATPAATSTSTADQPITTPYALATLISLLPRPGTTTRFSAGDAGPGWVGGTVVYDDGHGAAELGVGITFPYDHGGRTQREAPASLCGSPAVQQNKSVCNTLPDGSQVAVYKGDDNVQGGPTNWGVRLLRTDGVEVDIDEYNAPTEKQGAPSRTDPPFTITELTAIAGSGEWQPTISRVEAEQAARLVAGR
jgi:hypothetical protein